MKYQELVDVYSSLEATTKRLEKTEIIANYLKTLDSDTIEKVGLLILGTVFPAWSSEEIGIGGKLVERAVAVTRETSGLPASSYTPKSPRSHSFHSH